MRRLAVGLLAAAAVVLAPSRAWAYSVLTHEALIDATWNDSIAPILRERFHPSAEALRQARAYAYGGSLIQDIGYYPLSSVIFGQLTHYVRPGDFVAALVRESRTLDEEAFALGALSHFVADTEGHPLAVNTSVPLLYPKLRAKYGSPVTYEDDPAAHLQTEFGFDVVQVARGAYLPQAYRDFVGFEVSRPVLERAFQATYGVPLDVALPNYDLAVGTFRKTVGTIIPAMTNIAWETKRDEITKQFPGMTSSRFVFALPRNDYEAAWGKTYRRPPFHDRLVSWIIRIVPKVGPFRVLAFKPPTPEAERLFQQSFARAVEEYRGRLREIETHRTSRPPNLNLDTGQPVRPGTYRLVDETYARWLRKLEDDRYAGLSASMRTNLLAFYSHPEEPIATESDRGAWRKVLRELDDLRRNVRLD